MSLKIAESAKILGSDSYEVYLLGAFFKYLQGSLIENFEIFYIFAGLKYKIYRVMTGKVTYSTVNNFFGNMEAGMCATATPPVKILKIK